MQSAPNEDEASEPELVIGECEPSEVGQAWLRAFDTRIRGNGRLMLELYIMIEGTPFRARDVTEWLATVMEDHLGELLDTETNRQPSGGDTERSDKAKQIENKLIADRQTEGGSAQVSDPLLVSLGGGRYTLHPNHVESICERNTDHLRLRTEEDETASETGEVQESDDVNPTTGGAQLPPAEAMQFPPEVLEIQAELDEDRQEDSAQEPPQEDPDQRGWVYVLWSPAHPTWIVTGKGKSRTRPESYNTYTPHRDFLVVGIAYTENGKDSEKQLQDEIDKIHPGTRGRPASNGTKSEWFEITREQAYEILERLNPANTHRNIPEEE
jgi:hypothetical protein